MECSQPGCSLQCLLAMQHVFKERSCVEGVQGMAGALAWAQMPAAFHSSTNHLLLDSRSAHGTPCTLVHLDLKSRMA